MQLTAETGGMLTHILAGVFFLISFTFVYRSFYGMRIHVSEAAKEVSRAPAD